MTKLEKIAQAGVAYNVDGKAAFKREAMRLLRAIVRAAGLKKGEYRCSFNEGGIAVSGEAMLHTDTRFICIEVSCIGGLIVLVRNSNGLKDSCGGQNNYVPVSSLYDAEQFAATVLADGPLQLPRAA